MPAAGMPAAPRSLALLVAVVGLGAALLPPAAGDTVELADGRVLEGRFAILTGVAVDPAVAEFRGETGGPILMCDDDLTRTMVSKRRVTKVEPGAVGLGQEKITIPQRVPEAGRRVAAVGGIVEATPFDEFGRRIISLASASGRIELVQGITRITPRWTSLEGILTEQPMLLDQRVATSSIPRDVLRRVIDQQIDRTNADDRLRIVRLLLQSERYDEARAELDEVLADFPGLANLADERRRLAQLAATRLLDEVLLRGRVGQDRLAMRLLEGFPAADAGGEVLERVREARDDYRDRQERARRLVDVLRERTAALGDEAEAAAAGRAVDEIAAELSFAALERLSTFERLGTDPELPAERAVALGISSWLAGAGAATDNLKFALSTLRVRDLLRDYLAADEAPPRRRLRERLGGEEAFAAETLAAIARQMRPPRAPPPATAPGLHTLTVPGLDGDQPRECLVQLPPEYDPLRRYPAVVSLHAAWTTPLNQVEWWAGPAGGDGIRQGQATRHGTIVIAPQWSRPGQTAYEYSAREHAAVLDAVRAALGRFSIDTDRVFLSGHSIGGDAAWDIALAHPDLWAGLVAIAPAAGKYVNHYWHNARTLPIYAVGGELDAAGIARNGMDLDRCFAKGFDTTYVEYRGRGHEHFSDEILRIFAWMQSRRRDFLPRSIDVVTMRPWDNFFWWIEMAGAPARTVVLPTHWPPPKDIRPFTIEGKATAANALAVRCGADRVRIWLSPELVDFTAPVTVTLDGRKLTSDAPTADVDVMLEDLRTRCDRQHPFWGVVESSRGRR